MLLALALTAALHIAPHPSPAPAQEDAFAELVQGYEGALAEWQVERVRRRHPARSYYGRFADLAEAGEGRALVWMAEHLRDAGLSVIARHSELTRIYLQLLEEHRDQGYALDAFLDLPRHAADVDARRLVPACRAASDATAERETRAALWFALSGLLAASEREDQRREAQAIRGLLTAEYAGTRAATAVDDLVAEELETAWMTSEGDRGAILTELQRLAAAGSQRARLFLLQNAAGAPDEVLPWLEELIAESPDAPWMADLASQLGGLAAGLGVERTRRLYEAWIQGTGDRARALALRYELGKLLLIEYGEDEVKGSEALAMLREVQEADPEGLGRRIEGEINRLLYLRLGAVAPDFEGVTVDGETFRLSDYRGKVTVVDFWGFW